MENKENDHLLSTTTHFIGSKYLNESWVWSPQYYWYNNAKYVLLYENLKEDFKDFLKKRIDQA
jgi:hypothetical protein